MTSLDNAARFGADRGFPALGVPAALTTVLTRAGIDTPTPIQAATLPDSLAGRDVLGRARTGSGKTLAFLLPVLARLSQGRGRSRPGHPRALILVPTRELAVQVATAATPLAAAVALRVVTVYGGVAQKGQATALAGGADLCIATPGRLEDLIRQRLCSLQDVEVSVVDEADHMADLGFLPPVRRLLDDTAAGGQRLLFSATLDDRVQVLVDRYLQSPTTHFVDAGTSAVPLMDHHVFDVRPSDKAAVVRELVSGDGRTLAFTRTKHGARKLAKQLTDAGVPALELHGNLSQGARSRHLAAFGAGRVRTLVATDIAARGIHIDNVGLVVHVDPPAEHTSYLHRSGRTARAGAGGTVVTLGTPDQLSDIRRLLRRAGIRPTTRAVSAGDDIIRELTGPVAEHIPAASTLRAQPAPRRLPAAQPSRQAGAAADGTPRSFRRRPHGRRRQPA